VTLARKLAIRPELLAAAAAGVVLLDQWTKYLVVSRMPVGARHELIRDILFLVHVVNKGAAWGMMHGRMNVLALISIAVFVLLVVYFRRFTERVGERELALALLLGGIGGNLIDRLDLIPRPSGMVGVVDFISVQYVPRQWEYPSFNVADSAICVGVATYCLSCWLRRLPEPAAAKPAAKRDWRQVLRDWLLP
jgi:signal peptidase II